MIRLTLAVQVKEQTPRVNNGKDTNHNDKADQNQVVDRCRAVSEQIAQFRAVERCTGITAVQIDREDDEHAQQQEEHYGLEQCVDDHDHFVSHCSTDDAKDLHGNEHRETCNWHPLIDIHISQGHNGVSLKK